MATLLATINGNDVTIDPAVEITVGPSRQSANFQSQFGSGVSQPITIILAQPVPAITITIVGQSYNPHTSTAYDSNGTVVATVITNVSPEQADNGNGRGTTDVNLSGNNIKTVVLTPSPADYVAYRVDGFTIKKPASIPVAPPPPLPAPPLAPAPSPIPPQLPPAPVIPLPPPMVYTQPVIDPKTTRATSVSQMYTISPNTFNFATRYVLGQTQIIPDVIYRFKNITLNVDLLLTTKLPSWMMINIDPSQVVKPGQEIAIVVRFNKENATNTFLSDRQTTRNEQLSWLVKPINITEPVYVPL